MSSFNFSFRVLIGCLCLALSRGLVAADKPNIVFVITDDQGYADIAAHGNPVVKTPHLDRLRNESVRFEDFMVSPTCSPTRSSLMSGRHEFKNGVTHTILERERMSLKTTTLPQMLKTAGYTTGIFGKWHLGDEAAYQPNQRGFDEVFIHGAGGIGQSYVGSCGDAPGNRYFNPALLHNGKFEKTQGYCTDLFFQQAEKWIGSVKGKQPFFAYIATNAPHGPLHCPPEYEARYPDQPKDVASFFGMITNIDDNLGRLLGKLREWGIENDTLVIFMNDNGGTVGCKLFNAGMRGTKVTPYMGGIRAANFWRWPGKLMPAAVHKLTAHIDIFPTLMELTGTTVPANVKAQWDGRSFLPLLSNSGAEWSDRHVFTHVGRWPKGSDPQLHKVENCSIRNSQFHLVAAGKNAKWELFDLKTDPGEQTDVSQQHPNVVKSLLVAYDQWWAEAVPLMENENAVGPKENPFKELYEKQFGRAGN